MPPAAASRPSSPSSALSSLPPDAISPPTSPLPAAPASKSKKRKPPPGKLPTLLLSDSEEGGTSSGRKRKRASEHDDDDAFDPDANHTKDPGGVVAPSDSKDKAKAKKPRKSKAKPKKSQDTETQNEAEVDASDQAPDTSVAPKAQDDDTHKDGTTPPPDADSHQDILNDNSIASTKKKSKKSRASDIIPDDDDLGQEGGNDVDGAPSTKPKKSRKSKSKNAAEHVDDPLFLNDEPTPIEPSPDEVSNISRHIVGLHDIHGDILRQQPSPTPLRTSKSAPPSKLATKVPQKRESSVAFDKPREARTSLSPVTLHRVLTSFLFSRSVTISEILLKTGLAASSSTTKPRKLGLSKAHRIAPLHTFRRTPPPPPPPIPKTKKPKKKGDDSDDYDSEEEYQLLGLSEKEKRQRREEKRNRLLYSP